MTPTEYIVFGCIVLAFFVALVNIVLEEREVKNESTSQS